MNTCVSYQKNAGAVGRLCYLVDLDEADDVLTGHKPSLARIGAVRAIVTHYEVATIRAALLLRLGTTGFRDRPITHLSAVCRTLQVRLRESLGVDDYGAIGSVNSQRLAGQGDYALNETAIGTKWSVEHDYIPSLR
jgi:hypothetical protein